MTESMGTAVDLPFLVCLSVCGTASCLMKNPACETKANAIACEKWYSHDTGDLASDVDTICDLQYHVCFLCLSTFTKEVHRTESRFYLAHTIAPNMFCNSRVFPSINPTCCGLALLPFPAEAAERRLFLKLQTNLLTCRCCRML